MNITDKKVPFLNFPSFPKCCPKQKQSVYLSLAEPRVLHARVPVRGAGEVAASASGGGVLYPSRGVVVLLPESGGLPVKCGSIVMSDAPDISHGRYL